MSEPTIYVIYRYVILNSQDSNYCMLASTLCALGRCLITSCFQGSRRLSGMLFSGYPRGHVTGSSRSICQNQPPLMKDLESLWPWHKLMMFCSTFDRNPVLSLASIIRSLMQADQSCRCWPLRSRHLHPETRCLNIDKLGIDSLTRCTAIQKNDETLEKLK